MRSLRVAALAAGVLMAGTLASRTQEAGSTIDPVAACRCHDSLGAPDARGSRIDLRSWFADGPHKSLGCTGCHPGTDLPSHPTPGVAKVDCEHCHAEQAREFAETVHGRVDGTAGGAGGHRLRGCLTCHAEHKVLKPGAPEARWTNTGLLYSCAACHKPMALRAGFTLPLHPAPAGKPWPSSFHGLVVRKDRRFVAACESCHGAHRIFPSSDPRSSLNVANVVANCGACHAGVTKETAHAGVKSPLPGPLSNFFEVWYLWGGGTVALTLVGVVGALVAGAILRRRLPADGPAGPKTKHD